MKNKYKKKDFSNYFLNFFLDITKDVRDAIPIKINGLNPGIPPGPEGDKISK